MAGSVGYLSGAAKALPDNRTVTDSFHVDHLAADRLTVCRQRIQQTTTGRRGRSGDPLYTIRRDLLTRKELLTDKQKTRLWKALVARGAADGVEVTYRLHQGLINACEQPGWRDGQIAM